MDQYIMEKIRRRKSFKKLEYFKTNKSKLD